MKTDDAYTYAWDHAARNPDGSVIEDSLVAILAVHVDFDVDQARRGLAQRIVARRRRPGQTAPEGSIVFPGMEHYAFEPQRLLADNDGNLIPNEHARIKYKAAEAGRAQADVSKAASRATREQTESSHFAIWADEQYGAGRNPAEITWGSCVRETGLWKDGEAENSADVDEDYGDAS